MKKIITVSLLVFVFIGFSRGFDLQQVLEKAGNNRIEVERFIDRSKKEGYGDWAQFLLSSMPDVDLVNFRSDDFISYFQAVEKNRKRVPWGNKVDDFLFYHYILPHRVSQEPLEDFTAVYADTLYDIIEDAKDMRQAVLRINEWVYTRMKYEPTSRWDQNASVTIDRGFGRCEEMAILCIKALRSVFIPARKVYSPWWPFTNSNHAWVEVWIDGKWHYIGGGEPTDLENAWFFLPAKRAAIIEGVVYGDIEEGEEVIYKKKEGYTIINTTPNYCDTKQLIVMVNKDNSPAESVSVSICVYNYSSLPPVGIKKTDDDGFVSFTVGLTDLFIYAAQDSLIDYSLWKPTGVARDTVVLELSKKEFPDTSFWLHTRRLDKKKKEPQYKPNKDSLKLLQERHFCRINIVDISLASILDEKDEKLIKIFYHAKGKGKLLLSYYKDLDADLNNGFIDYFDALHPKDIVSVDTVGLTKEIEAMVTSVEWANQEIPDSVIRESLISDRILFEQIGKWRDSMQTEFIDFRKEDIEKTVNTVFSWVIDNIQKVEERGYFGPMKNSLDVYRTGCGMEEERFILICGILRSLGIPARVKWSYDAFEYWDRGWKEMKFEKEKKKKEKAWVSIFFEKDDVEIEENRRYYYDYSITKFAEYPRRLDPPVDTMGGNTVVTLDKEPLYAICGWRNGFGDTYVRIKQFLPTKDTSSVTLKEDIPEDVKPGDLIVRKYRQLELEDFDIEKEELNKGGILIIVFDTESEASKSTLKNAKDAINDFPGKVFLFASTETKERAEYFLKEMGISKGEVYTVSKEIYKKEFRVKNLPSIIYLEDGNCVFWVEGLFLHLERLIEDISTDHRG
jgi:hypothetical protein